MKCSTNNKIEYTNFIAMPYYNKFSNYTLGKLNMNEIYRSQLGIKQFWK